MSFKVVLFCGGTGSRLSEYTMAIPKPLVPIGDEMPIMWHVMKTYSKFGFNDFVLLAGYKQDLIKQFFNNYYLNTSDITFDYTSNKVVYHNNTNVEPWKITILDTGDSTLTGDRLLYAKKYLKDAPFLLNYADGVSDIDIRSVIDNHNQSRNIATLSAVQPAGRYGNLSIAGGQVSSFIEKSKGDGTWINGGYFVVNPSIFSVLQSGDFAETLRYLADNNLLGAYTHNGFWKAMDTAHDKIYLDQLWNENKAPWKVW